jgi:hypothetical protein
MEGRGIFKNVLGHSGEIYVGKLKVWLNLLLIDIVQVVGTTLEDV